MAIQFDGTDYLTSGSPALSGPPCTIVAWARPRLIHKGYVAVVGNASDTGRQGIFFQNNGTVLAMNRGLVSGGSVTDRNAISTVLIGISVTMVIGFTLLSKIRN